MATKPAAKPAVAKNKKPATHAKAAAKPPTNAQLAAEIKTLETSVKKLQTEVTAETKHTAAKPSAKHSTAKKQPAKAKAGSAKHATATKPAAKKGAPLPGGVACCAAEGLAASLRMLGKPVSADDVLGLYWLTPGADEDGASILATLATAQWYGLAGAYPVFRPASSLTDGVVAGVTLPSGLGHTATIDGGGVRTWGEWRPARRSFTDAIEEAWVIEWQ